MATIRRILCATDFSPASAPAWEFAQRLALSAKTDLLLVHVIPPFPIPADGGFDPHTYLRIVEDARAEALTAGDRLARTAIDRGLRATVRIDEGPAATRVLALADAERVDLLVLGTHGRTGLNRLLVGSVAEQVVQLATHPVVTVRPHPALAQLPRSAPPEPAFEGAGEGESPVFSRAGWAVSPK